MLKISFTRNLAKYIAISLCLITLPLNQAHAVTTCTVTQSSINGIRVDSITSTAACTYDIPTGFNNATVLVVGGGGGGGWDAGAGGGGGGVQIRSNLSVSAGDIWDIDIGAGGTGASANTTSTQGEGSDGERSVVSGSGYSITAEQGRGGGNCIYSNSYCHRNIGGDAGAGGGQGGTGVYFGIVGANTITGGEAGSAFQIGSTRLMFGGGGGAASGGTFAASSNNGGAGGGGNGGLTGVAPTSGAANSGGGGGASTGSGAAGSGAAGIVLFVLQNFDAASSVSTSCTSGNVSKVQSGLEVILTYSPGASSDGQCTLAVPTDVYAVHYLVVAGGGGGASGGGGGGGVVTSWRTINSSGSQLSATSSPTAVSPGSNISITVGRGGAYGTGGNSLCYGAPAGVTCGVSFMAKTTASSGNDSSFGSVVAKGGGRGGQGISGGGVSNSNIAAFGGGSGGGSGFDVSASAANSSPTTVVGATTLGSVGGGSTGSGGYRAGSGGGGSDTCQNDTVTITNNTGVGCGKTIRTIWFSSNATGATYATSTSSNASNSGGGGNGGNGAYSNIGSFEGTFVAYGCGGGGGLNNNQTNSGIAVTIWGAGGKAGCGTAGRGSNKSTVYNNVYSDTGTAINDFNGGRGIDGFGGGGGGTDPEDMVAGKGGNGVVIVRFYLPDSHCPNDHNDNTAARPIACIAKLKITAGDTSASTQSARTVDVRNSPISYSNASDTLTIVTSISGMTVSIVNDKIVASVASSSSPLIGGTYPVAYQLTSSSTTSQSYVLITVRDPLQHTQTKVPIDPRDLSVTIPRIIIGQVTAVQVCVTPRANPAYVSSPTVSLVRNSGGTTNDSPNGNNLRMQGTSESITANISQIRVVSTNGRLIKSWTPITLDVNVSNTSTGGNGACDFGTDSVMSVYAIQLTQTRSYAVPQKNGKQR